MLTPARPSKGDPLFKEKMVQFRLDQEDQKRNPHNWGVERPSRPGATATGRKPRGKAEAGQ